MRRGGPATARNKKVVRFTIRLDEAINDRLETLADAMGQNKGTTASVTLAAGLSVLESVYLNSTPEEVAEVAVQLKQRINRDTEKLVDLNT